MQDGTIPTLSIPLPGLSDESLGQVIEILNREGKTFSQWPFAEMDAIARHFDRQLQLAISERAARQHAAALIRQTESSFRSLGASVRHTNPIQIPA